MSDNVRQEEELSTQRRARILGLNYVDTSIGEKRLYKDLIPPQELIKLRVVPLSADAGSIVFGITNTTAQQTMQSFAQRFQDQRVAFALISDTGFREYAYLYNPPKQVIYEDITLEGAGTDELILRVSSTLEQIKADDMLAYLVAQAHKLGASDIHIETQREFVRIRLRIDGVLHPIAKLSNQKYKILISAIASAGNVSTATDQPQQGHIAQKVRMADGTEVDVNVRLETVPTINDMDVVMRLFNMDQEMYKLDRLGLAPDEREVVDNIISRPSGLVLVVGPTGSGKTTTLYSMLNSLNSTERKIITIEDPVEYQLLGITQISVTTKSGSENSFAERLRAVLRLDPDIVMVGEIRDMDTARTALQASLTGHLVLSTFHASSAAAALTRLMDVIEQNPLYLSAIRLVMAQRLVRRLDDSSKEPYNPDNETLHHIHAVLDSLPASVQKPDFSNLQLFRPKPAPGNPYGFRGQVAIREQFLMSGEILSLLERGGAPSVLDIESAAINSGMRTMLQDGLLKVCAGETTLEEVYRVIG